MSGDSITVHRYGHPGGGHGRARATPKGRQVRPEARAAIRALLGDRPRRRDLLIEHLHLIQDRYGHLSADHLAALAAEMHLAQAEVFEVATFYAHFDVVREGETPPPGLTIRVCDSLSCTLAGADALIAALENGAGRDDVRILRAPCLGRCESAPVAMVGQRAVARASAQVVAEVTATGETTPVVPAYTDFDAYEAAGGYALLRACRSGARTVEAIIGLLEDSALRGLGGAGFPTGRKWRLVRDAPAPRLLAVNADEGEPGTFKDRVTMERDPHRFLEGVLIAGWAVEAADIYIYLRDEYPHIREILTREIARIEEAGLCDGTAIHLRRGAGAYICGEESAMLESIEGKRGLPRHRPPYVAERGLFGRPTLVNNVETLYWVRDIVERGPGWFVEQGRNGGKGLRSYSVSGRVREPGVKLAPAGITVRELIDEFCGGMAEGHRFHGYLPGGASGGILPASKGNLPLDFGRLEGEGCFVGSHAVIVLSDRDDMAAVARNLMRFFAHESCGQCTPCRLGTEKALALMAAPRCDEALLTEIGRCMADASICGLGQAAANPLNSVLTHFPPVVESNHG